MPPGEQIAFEPALAEMLAQHLHHAPVGRDVIVVGQRCRAIQTRSVTSNTASSRFDAVSSGPMMRKLRARHSAA